MSLGGIPRSPVAVPAAVHRWAAGRPVEPLWHNEMGGLTFRIGVRHVIKWTPAASRVDLSAEVERLCWARTFTLVPRVVDNGADGAGSWFASERLPGRSAVDERWKADPAVAVTAIGRGLRALHDRLPVDECPFDWSAQRRLARVTERAAQGRIDPSRWQPEHRQLTVAGAQDRLAALPPVDRLVVCHGDACAPNTLLDDNGSPTAHVDFGLLGLADRWADLAIATWSTGWNYGPGWEDMLLQAYGVDPDPERTAYYRLLQDLGD